MLLLVKKTLAENQKALVLCPMPEAGAIDTDFGVMSRNHGSCMDLTTQMVLIIAMFGCLAIWQPTLLTPNICFFCMECTLIGLDSRDVSVCLMGSRMNSCNKHVITGKYGKSLITLPLAITLRMRKGMG